MECESARHLAYHRSIVDYSSITPYNQLQNFKDRVATYMYCNLRRDSVVKRPDTVREITLSK